MTKFSSADVTSLVVVGSEGCQVRAVGCAPDGKWQGKKAFCPLLRFLYLPILAMTTSASTQLFQLAVRSVQMLLISCHSVIYVGRKLKKRVARRPAATYIISY